MADAVNEALRRFCESSEKRLPLQDLNAVRTAYGQGQLPSESSQALCERLKTLIESPDPTEVSAHTLLTAARTFAFQRVAGVSDQAWDGVLRALRFPFPPNAY